MKIFQIQKIQKYRVSSKIRVVMYFYTTKVYKNSK